jgi:hypothetical protein
VASRGPSFARRVAAPESWHGWRLIGSRRSRGLVSFPELCDVHSMHMGDVLDQFAAPVLYLFANFEGAAGSNSRLGTTCPQVTPCEFVVCSWACPQGGLDE